MLKHTFIHIQGIGTVTEQRLWEMGLHDWDCLNNMPKLPLSLSRIAFLKKGISESNAYLRCGDASFFSDRMPANQSWRLFPDFRHATVYLDIETTGLDRDRDRITTIVLYDGQSIHTYVRGQNLDEFLSDIQRYKVIVTYNGKCFDIPFIERYFNTRLYQAQIDLRYILSSLGYQGGLKACEARMGLDRGELSGIDGFFAVLMWREYQKTGRREILETLLAYNTQDTINLEALMVAACNMKLRQTPFYDTLRSESPPSPKNPFQIDNATVARIKAGAGLGYHF